MKRFTHKQLIIGGASLLLLATGGTTFALTRPEPEQHVSQTKTTNVKPKTVTANEPQTIEEPAATETTPEPAPTPNAPAPVEVPAPTNAGDVGTAVSDKATIMTSAGIIDQTSADKVITTLSNWRSTSDGSKTLCAVTPPAKMARFGADYLTNPVTQLKYCDWLATATYGGWAGWAKSLGY